MVHRHTPFIELWNIGSYGARQNVNRMLCVVTYDRISTNLCLPRDYNTTLHYVIAKSSRYKDGKDKGDVFYYYDEDVFGASNVLKLVIYERSARIC